MQRRCLAQTRKTEFLADQVGQPRLQLLRRQQADALENETRDLDLCRLRAGLTDVFLRQRRQCRGRQRRDDGGRRGLVQQAAGIRAKHRRNVGQGARTDGNEKAGQDQACGERVRKLSCFGQGVDGRSENRIMQLKDHEASGTSWFYREIRCVELQNATPHRLATARAGRACRAHPAAVRSTSADRGCTGRRVRFLPSGAAGRSFPGW